MRMEGRPVPVERTQSNHKVYFVPWLLNKLQKVQQNAAYLGCTASLRAVLRTYNIGQLLHTSGTCPGDGRHYYWYFTRIHKRTCGLSYQIKRPTIVKLAIFLHEPMLASFTIVGPLIWCDNPQVRLSKILYINNNDFHHLGRSQMCAGGCYVFRTSKPHSGTLC